MKKALITGVTGQDGSYLAKQLLGKGYYVIGAKRRTSTFNTQRIDDIYNHPKFKIEYFDLSDASSINRLVSKYKPDEYYNLACQSHVRVSFDAPEDTINGIVMGTLYALEAIKNSSPSTRFYQASSSEMFGDNTDIQVNSGGFDENSTFSPASPYAIGKLAAHNLVRNYRKSYGLHASCGILFNHECLTFETPLIIKKNGIIDIVQISEIVPHRTDPSGGKKYTTICKGGFDVWDGNDWTKVKTLTATWNDKNNDKEIYFLKARGGCYRATASHISFLESEKEIETKDIKSGDRMELKPLPKIETNTSISLDEAELIGFLVGDGYISKDGRSARFVNNDIKLLSRVEELWKKVACGHVRYSRCPSGFKENTFVRNIQLSGNCNYLKYLRQNLYNKHSFKRIPKNIINGTFDIHMSFLEGYNASDGLKFGHQKTKFKSFKTNSSILAQGLWFILENSLKLRTICCIEERNDKIYYTININTDKKTNKGKHMRRPLNEVKENRKINYEGWVFDVETESGTFSAGVGNTWVHNSPMRGETFVTRKITKAAAKIKLGLQDKLELGNLKAFRDWGYAPEFTEAMQTMLQQEYPDDYVIATGETHTVKEFLDCVFEFAGLNVKKHLKINKDYFRPHEVPFLLGNSEKAKNILGWEPKVKFKELARLMYNFDLESLK